jgi:polysaccharide deacetylase family protein (PEP-CTERM system associated)
MTQRKRNLPQTTTRHAVPNNLDQEGTTQAITNAFSVDVEDYYQVSGFDKTICRTQWPGYKSRVVRNTNTLLDLLEEKNVVGTFYILGYVAEQHPELVKAIANAGHEIGCHSYWHRRVNRLSPDEFREDTLRAKSGLEELTGLSVENYRAPSFSITHDALWAWDILAELGFKLDSSLCPARHGNATIPNGPHIMKTQSGKISQFPISVKRFGKFSLPISGGGYFRLLPLNWTIRELRRVNQTAQPFVFYIHPWELDPHQPRIKGAKWSSKLKHYARLSRTQEKLSSLLDTFRFSTVESSIKKTSK